MENREQIAHLLEEIRANQKTQLERQAESLDLQREQLRLYQKQCEQATRIQDRSEAIQERSAQLINRARKLFPFMVLVMIALIAYVTWLLLRLKAL